MGLVHVQISSQLWQEMFTEGWKVGDGEVVKCIECIEGLPKGAVCKSVFYQAWPKVSIMATAPDLIFVFEHPDFDEVEPGAPIPMMHIVHQRHYLANE